ncbi:hypothetical protein [Henriciella sp.]|uniref:hypothetical protein n=1 Tax=Henriciella sp. TaxID=1968823 RepID=UPI0025C361F5|nr:hypothetical protein [Henriciella sp.]
MSSQLMDDVYLPDLGIGAGIAIWGFRACARGGAGCCAIVNGFGRAFGPANGPRVLNDMLEFARHVGHSGRRTVSLAMPGCARLASDELSIIAALAAAQLCDRALLELHLTWLMAKAPDEELAELLLSISSDFLMAELVIDMPDLAISQPRTARSPLVAVQGGRA